MKKSLLMLLMATLVFSFFVPLGSAATVTYMSVNVVLAADEEMTGHGVWVVYVYSSPVYMSWKQYALFQTTGANIDYYRGLRSWRFRFYIIFNVIDYVTWSSDNDALGVDFYNDMINKLGWYSGKLYNNQRADILIGWTRQSNLKFGGATDRNKSAVVIVNQDWWADDNAVVHEVSHLYGVHDHYLGDDGYESECVMSHRPVWVDWLWEEGTLLIVYSEILQAYLTYNYHSACALTIQSNLDSFGTPMTVTFRVNGGSAPKAM